MSRDTDATSFYLRVSFRCLTSPASILAIAVLLINDHMLKRQYPSWLTGKLSDFAGLYFAPYLFLIVVLSITWMLGRKCHIRWGSQNGKRKRAISLLAGSVFLGTAVVFSAMKVSADTASQLLHLIGGLTGLSLFVVSDPSDLVAVVVIPIAFAAWRREFAHTRTVEGMFPSAGMILRRIAQLLVLGIATIAVTATSQGPGVPSTVGLAVDPSDPNTLYTIAGNYVYRTTDGAKTWGTVASCTLQSVYSQYSIPVPGHPGVFYALVEDRRITVDPGPVQTMVAKERPSEPPPAVVYGTAESAEVWKCGLNLTDSVPVWAPPLPTPAIPTTRAPYLHMPPVVEAPAWKPDLLFVAVNSKVMRTPDGGQTWAALSPSQDSSGTVTALASDPSRPGTIFAAIGSHLLRSDDSGDSWTGVGEAPEPLVGLKVHPLNSQFLVGVARNAFLITRDGGRTWREIGADNKRDEYTAFRGVRMIVFDTTHPKTIYVVPINYGLFISEDEGASWNKSFDGNVITGLVITTDPDSRVYIADSVAGVLRLRDPDHPSTSGWEPMNSYLPKPTSSSR